MDEINGALIVLVLFRKKWHNEYAKGTGTEKGEEQHCANNRNPANNQFLNSNKSSWSSRGPPIAAVAATTYKSSYQEEVSAMTTVG